MPGGAASPLLTVHVLSSEAVTVLGPPHRRKPAALARFAAIPWSAELPRPPGSQKGKEQGGKQQGARSKEAAPACCKYQAAPWVVARTLEAAGFQPTTEEDADANVLWVVRARLEMDAPLLSTASSLGMEGLLPLLRPHQRVNHFPGTIALTVKDKLVHGLRAAKRGAAERGLETSAYGFLPETYTLPAELRQLTQDAAATPERK